MPPASNNCSVGQQRQMPTTCSKVCSGLLSPLPRPLRKEKTRAPPFGSNSPKQAPATNFALRDSPKHHYFSLQDISMKTAGRTNYCQRQAWNPQETNKVRASTCKTHAGTKRSSRLNTTARAHKHKHNSPEQGTPRQDSGSTVSSTTGIWQTDGEALPHHSAYRSLAARSGNKRMHNTRSISSGRARPK